jgi:hypothetical protein
MIPVTHKGGNVMPRAAMSSTPHRAARGRPGKKSFRVGEGPGRRRVPRGVRAWSERRLRTIIALLGLDEAMKERLERFIRHRGLVSHLCAREVFVVGLRVVSPGPAGAALAPRHRGGQTGRRMRPRTRMPGPVTAPHGATRKGVPR